MSLVSCFYCFSGRATREARTGGSRNYLPLRKITYQWQGRSREALWPQIARCVLILDVIVRHSAVIRNIRIDYSSKHLGLSCSGMAGGKLSTIVFSNGYRRGMDTRLLGIRHNGSCYRRSFDWVSGRTGYFGHRISDKDPFFILWDVFVLLYLKEWIEKF